ncbi:MAG: hypothetical protein LBU15_00405 [Rickettsiales bacterium]|jgi:hypothetical protein|nr:hypothetical protein [Rickettsiales bacterium]
MYNIEKRTRGKAFSVSSNGKNIVLTLFPTGPTFFWEGGTEPAVEEKISGQDYSFQFLLATSPDPNNLKAITVGGYGSYSKSPEIGATAKRISETYLKQSIGNIKPLSMAGNKLDLQLDTEFIYIYSMTHSSPEKKGKNISVKCHIFGFLDENNLPTLESGKIDIAALRGSIAQIQRRESGFVCIFLEHSNHVSTLAVDLDHKQLYSFDPGGENSKHFSLLSGDDEGINHLNRSVIQGASGCGYIAMAFATTLIKTQNMATAERAAKGLGTFLAANDNINSKKTVETTLNHIFLEGKDMFERLEMLIKEMKEMEEKKKRKIK